jgi:membrane-associated phospholipid phosphatase
MPLRLKKVEWLYLFFLLGLSGLTVLNIPRLPSWPLVLGIYGLTALGYLLVILLDTRWPYKFFELLRRWAPYAGILPTFHSLGYITQNIRPDLDRYLIGIDYRMLGVHPTVWLERLAHPLFVDVLALAYSSYYFLPIVLALFLHFDQKHHELEHLFLAVTIGFFLSYVGYLLVPAIGPRFTLAALQHIPVKGQLVANQLLDFLNAGEFNKRDCFPSGHTGITLIVLYYAHAHHRRLFWVLLPVASLLILATVFLRLHYVIDVLAGFALAALAILISEIWNPHFLRLPRSEI